MGVQEGREGRKEGGREGGKESEREREQGGKEVTVGKRSVHAQLQNAFFMQQYTSQRRKTNTISKVFEVIKCKDKTASGACL